MNKGNIKKAFAIQFLAELAKGKLKYIPFDYNKKDGF